MPLPELIEAITAPPGDTDPRLVVSITFVPRSRSERWQDVQLRTLEVRAGDRTWTPRQSSVAAYGDGGFEVRAFGEATLPAGAKAALVVALQTASGEMRLELPVDIQRVT